MIQEKALYSSQEGTKNGPSIASETGLGKESEWSEGRIYCGEGTLSHYQILESSILGTRSQMSRSRRGSKSARAFCRGLLVLLIVMVCGSPVLTAKEKKSSNDVESDVEFGIKMAQRGLWKEALFRFQQASLQQPNDSRLLNNIAVAYEAVGAYDKALETYKMGLQANAADRELKQNYSRFLEFYQAYNPEQPSEADKAAEAQAAAMQEDSEPTEDESEAEADGAESEEEGAQADRDPGNEPQSSDGVAQSSDRPSSSSGQ